MFSSALSISFLVFVFLFSPVTLLNFGKAWGHNTTTVNQGHSHVLVGDGLDQIRLVLERLFRLRNEKLSDSLLGTATLERSGCNLSLILVSINGRVGSQHRDCE